MAIFANKNLDLTSHDTSFETVMVTVNFTDTKVNIVSVYRPPQSQLKSFRDELSSLLGFLRCLSRLFNNCGDFNIHLDVKSAVVMLISRTT